MSGSQIESPIDEVKHWAEHGKNFDYLVGKSAHIVLDDADFNSALPMAAMMACVMSGQSCILPGRILLPRSRYEEGIETLKTMMEGFPVGDPWTPATCRARRSAKRSGKRCLA